jgi:hypothetical protein
MQSATDPEWLGSRSLDAVLDGNLSEACDQLTRQIVTTPRSSGCQLPLQEFQPFPKILLVLLMVPVMSRCLFAREINLLNARTESSSGHHHFSSVSCRGSLQDGPRREMSCGAASLLLQRCEADRRLASSRKMRPRADRLNHCVDGARPGYPGPRSRYDRDRNGWRAAVLSR